MVDEMCKKYNQLKNVERRWENEAMMEWDKFTITFMMYGDMSKLLLRELVELLGFRSMGK